MIDLNLLNKALMLSKEGKLQEAEKLYHELLEADGENYLLLSSVGLFYVSLGDFEKAEEYLKKSCSIKETLGSVSALGFCEFEKREFDRAALTLEHALEFGENKEIYNKLVLSLFQIKSYKKAVEYAEKMYELYPEDADATANMVKALTQSGKLGEAEKMCVEYLKKHPDKSSLWFHLGFLKELIYSDDKQACECYKAAAELGNNEAFYNIAVSYQKMKDFKTAEEYYHKMLSIYPNDVDTITSLGMCLLTQRKFKEGYDYFFRRDKSVLDRKTNNPYRPGEKFPEEVVVMCDQGFGDHIQFARYLPFLQEKVKKVHLAVSDNLRGLFEKNFKKINYITFDEINPEMKSMRITDLAYILDMDFDHIPYSGGYIKSKMADIVSDKPKIGLCWEAGNAGIRTMINRTINIRLLEPILNLDNIQVYSFQRRDTLKGNDRYNQMINLAKDFKNFEDTARALNAMDIMITVDTSIAHLAGAMGKKTFLMLPYVSDWRWFGDTKVTPWYESVEIFKQQDPISWEEPIKEIICRINESYS